ncbi:hypothetical protein IJG93_03710 [Candidatus Saccharibacteria bacterium]|nr:hypothetical protein [Candidatus Saccharibacteria bacterium]
MKKMALFAMSLVFGLFAVANVWAEGEEGESLITAEQKTTIVDHCDAMKDSLKSLQRTDSRARVYLGRYYETILSNFITPLNIRLVENNISNTKLLDNQTNFAARRTNFNDDYISYQQSLEELVNINCKSEPEKFYEKLLVTREKRKIVKKDVSKMRGLTDEQKKLVEELRDGTGQ